MPQISVIMNVYNGAPYLREAIESVLAQSFADWELIIWDDCSTDASPRIAADYHDPRIQYFLAPELVPLGPARNAAITHARGEWIAFLDQDDVWAPDKLQKQMALAAGGDGAQIGLIYGRTVRFGSCRQRDFDHHHEFQPLPQGDIFIELFRSSCFIAISSAMIRRSAFNAIGGIPDQFQTICDYYLFIAIARAYQVAAVQDVVCWYRVHPSNMSLACMGRMHTEATRLIEAWENSLDSHLAAKRRRVHQTLVAFSELSCLQSMDVGLMRLLRHGSAFFLLSRPLIRLWRLTRRVLSQPAWKESTR